MAWTVARIMCGIINGHIQGTCVYVCVCGEVKSDKIDENVFELDLFNHRFIFIACHFLLVFVSFGILFYCVSY